MDNKNIPHLEKILKRKIPYNRKIKLYTNYNGANYFPTGASRFIEPRMARNSEKLEVSFNGTLYPEQIQALDHIKKHNCGLIDLKTGGGKSFLLMGIIDHYKHSTLIIVPTTKLLIEMKDKIKEFMGYDCGLWYSGKKELKDITITTSKSYCENLFPGFDILIVDEGDTNLSKTFIDKINLSNCNVLIGLTGTPSRIELDVNDLQLIYGPIISVGRYQEVPTEAIQYVYRRTHAEEIEYASDNFAESRNLMIQNKTRTEKIVKKLLDFKAKYNIILILTDRVEECNIIAEHIPFAKIIHGKTKIKNDIAALEEVKEKGGIIIGTRQKMGRGVDIPAIDCVCLVGAFKFKSAVIQAIGRALRKFPGKKDIGLYIFSDSNLRSQLYENKKTVEMEYKISVDRQFLN